MCTGTTLHTPTCSHTHPCKRSRASISTHNDVVRRCKTAPDIFGTHRRDDIDDDTDNDDGDNVDDDDDDVDPRTQWTRARSIRG